MTKIYQAVVRRFALRKLGLVTITTLVLIAGVASTVPLAEAFSWVSPIQVGINGYSVPFDTSMRTRPTDGQAFILGEAGYGSQRLVLTGSNNFGSQPDINDAGDTGGSMRNNLAFAQDGSGYFVWRHHPAGYQSYFRQMTAGGAMPHGVDLGGLYKAASGGGKELDLPDVAVSPLTGKVYIAGSVVTGPQHLGFGEFNPVTQTFANVTDGLPYNNGGEMKPRICVDTSQGRDDIHIVGWFGFNVYGIDRINGVWTPSAALTASGSVDTQGGGPLQYQLGASLSIACDSNGYAYAAFDSLNVYHSASSTGLARYTPGVGWALVNRYPNQYFSNGVDMGAYDIYGPPYSSNVCGGVPQIVGSSVTVTSDHRVWVSSGVNCGPYAGQSVASFSGNGNTLDTFERAIPYGPTSKKVTVDYSATSGRVYVNGNFVSPNQNLFSYALISGPPANFTATPVNYKRIDLSWTYPNPGTYTNVQLERSPDNANWTVLAQLPVSQLSYIDNVGLSPSTTYYYRIKGYNTASSSGYATASAATLAIPTPAFFTATSLSFKQINLDWTYPAPVDLTNVQLERSTDNASWNIIANLPISQVHYEDNNLSSPGTTYYYRLKGYKTGLSSAYVNASAMTLGPAYLIFDQAPGGLIEPGRVFAVLPKVSVRDVYYNTITTLTGNVTLSLTSRPAGSVFTGTKIVAVNNGVADFTGAGLTLDSIGNYVLQASVPGIPSGTVTTSVPIAVKGKLAFTNSPSPDPLANGQFSTTVQVQRISDNSKVTNYNGTITLSFKPDTRAAGAKLNTGLSVTGNVANGEVTLSNLVIDRVGQAYQLRADIGNTDPVTPVFSNSFDVLAKPTFTTIPSSSIDSNTSFTVVVTVQDANNATLANYNGPVTLTPSGGTLLGKTSVNAVAGVATFNYLAFSASGSHTLQASIPLGSTNPTSANINITTPTGCQPLVVNTTSQTGDNADTTCTTITLQGALSRVGSQTDKIIRFAPAIVSGGNPINLGTGPTTLPSGAGIQGGCDSNGPRVTLTVDSGKNFIIGPNSNIWGIALSGMRLSTPGGGQGNSISCFKVTT